MLVWQARALGSLSVRFKNAAEYTSERAGPTQHVHHTVCGSAAAPAAGTSCALQSRAP